MHEPIALELLLKAAVHCAERVRSVRNLTQNPMGASGPYGNRVRSVRTASERQSAVDFPSALRMRFGCGCYGDGRVMSDALNFSAENASGTSGTDVVWGRIGGKHCELYEELELDHHEVSKNYFLRMARVFAAGYLQYFIW